MDWEDFQTSNHALTHPDRVEQVGAKSWINRWIQHGEQEYQYLREMMLDELKSIRAQFRLSKRTRS